jgi:hypothetical protein
MGLPRGLSLQFYFKNHYNIITSPITKIYQSLLMEKIFMFPLFKKSSGDKAEINDMPPPPPKKKSKTDPDNHNDIPVRDPPIKKKKKLSKEEKLAIHVLKNEYRDRIIRNLSEELERKPTPEEIDEVTNIFIKEVQESGTMQIILDDYLKLKLEDAKINAPVLSP